MSECTKSGNKAGTGMCFKCGANSHTSKNCKARMPEGKSMLIVVGNPRRVGGHGL